MQIFGIKYKSFNLFFYLIGWREVLLVVLFYELKGLFDSDFAFDVFASGLTQILGGG